ncbi:Vba2 protein [Martiniozyma asiatica (nom. inval.)]|nr:Vba2 protein [Martiniozyma asiatica]
MLKTVVEENTPLLPTTQAKQPVISKSAFRLILICLYANVFLAAVDSTMVATLLGRISSDLDSQEHISWVASSYLLSCAAFQPLFGKISDVFGRKPVILFSTFCFCLGCLMCGIRNDLTSLVIGRFVTGIGGGGLTSLATISASDLVSMRERGLYQGYINIFYHAGCASGGIVAGFFDAYIGWRWAFLVQVPICFLTGIFVLKYFQLPEKEEDKASTLEKFAAIDWTGCFLLVTSLICLMIVSGTNNTELPIGSPLWTGLIGYTIMGFIAFYFWEKNVEQPVIPVEMLHNRTVLASSLNCWLISMNMFASLFYLPFYWSSVKGLSPLECGYRTIPTSLIASLTSIFTGLVIKRTSKYRTLHIISGWAIVLGSIVVYSGSKNDGAFKDSIISLLLRFGSAADITTILVAMISAVPQSEQALVTSIQYGFRSTGSTMGVSFASALMQYTLRGSLASKFDNINDSQLPDGWDSKMLNKSMFKALEDPSYAFSDIPGIIKTAVIDSYDKACHGVFLFLIITGFGSFIAIYFTEENDLDDKDTEN